MMVDFWVLNGLFLGGVIISLLLVMFLFMQLLVLFFRYRCRLLVFYMLKFCFVVFLKWNIIGVLVMFWLLCRWVILLDICVLMDWLQLQMFSLYLLLFRFLMVVFDSLIIFLVSRFWLNGGFFFILQNCGLLVGISLLFSNGVRFRFCCLVVLLGRIFSRLVWLISLFRLCMLRCVSYLWVFVVMKVKKLIIIVVVLMKWFLCNLLFCVVMLVVQLFRWQMCRYLQFRVIIGVVLKLKFLVLRMVVLIMFRLVFRLLLVCIWILLCRLLLCRVWWVFVRFSFQGELVYLIEVIGEVLVLLLQLEMVIRFVQVLVMLVVMVLMFGLDISFIDISVCGLICLRLKISCVRFLMEQMLWCGGGEIRVMLGIVQCRWVIRLLILLFGNWLFLLGLVFWVILICRILVLIRYFGVMLKWLVVICLIFEFFSVLQCVGFLLFLLELE